MLGYEPEDMPGYIEPGTNESLLKKKILELEYEIIQLKNRVHELELDVEFYAQQEAGESY
jgi:hypothetical protein